MAGREVPYASRDRWSMEMQRDPVKRTWPVRHADFMTHEPLARRQEP